MMSAKCGAKMARRLWTCGETVLRKEPVSIFRRECCGFYNKLWWRKVRLFRWIFRSARVRGLNTDQNPQDHSSPKAEKGQTGEKSIRFMSILHAVRRSYVPVPKDIGVK
jgi:hypothetical protein